MCRQPDPLLDAGLIASTPWRPDLHLHTTASDGLLSPREVVLRARAQGVNLMAVTDHDTLHGLEEAALTAREAGISFIPGIEISTQGEEEIHLLGYFVKRGNPGLDALLELRGRLGLNRPDFRSVLQARMEHDEQEVLAGDA